MTEEQSPKAAQIEQEPPEAVISAYGAVRLLLGLLAIWTFFSGIALIFFQDSAGATIGGGLDGGEGGAAQRLLGVHLLVLAPIYGVLAWRPRQYRYLLWVPYLAQGGVVAVTAFDIATGKRDLQDGILPFIVAAIFFVLLLYVWRSGRRPEVVTEGEEREVAEASDKNDSKAR
ncbi:MAG: hypothetical protein U1B78_02200 [Dehalococcoidia bacterium]|nr:hypothetical protein [Dehalococcoidia bacterium]